LAPAAPATPISPEKAKPIPITLGARGDILPDASVSPTSKKQFLVRVGELFCVIDNVTLGVESWRRVGLSCLGAANSYE
jgi:hypothetical protein